MDKGNRTRATWGLLLGAMAAVALLGLALGGGPALAARHGGVTNQGNGNGHDPALAVFQNGVQVSSVAEGTAFDVRGSGFTPGATVFVGPSGYADLVALTADAQGNVSRSFAGISIAGSYTFIAMVSNHDGWVIVASATLNVS